MEESSAEAAVQPRVAILSPYFRRAYAVEPTFRSIAEQTYTDFEAIIWDDGSPDDTWATMQSVVAGLSDPRFKIFRHEKNIGLTRGLNHAIALTSAEYIAIVGSGDTCDPRRIEEQVRTLDARPEAVFCATASTTYDPTTGATFFDSRHSSDTITSEDIRYGCPFTHGSVMYRASALREAGGYETTLKWCADWDMFTRLLRRGHAAYIDEVLYRRIAQLDGVSFNPEKSFEQIMSKRLVLRLSALGPAEREALLADVRARGIENVLDFKRDDVARDLARRNIKLFLMGREAAGLEMKRSADQRGIKYPPKYRPLVGVSRLMGKLPLDTDKLIRIARALPR
jgi:hypothetical protein